GAEGIGGRRRGRRITLNAQEARDSRSAPKPKIGRNTNGGREITSKPLRLVVIRAGETANVVGVWSGDAEGNGDSVGLDEGDGEAVDAWSAKFAHGCGGTLAQSLCTPRASPANGLTLV